MRHLSARKALTVLLGCVLVVGLSGCAFKTEADTATEPETTSAADTSDATIASATTSDVATTAPEASATTSAASTYTVTGDASLVPASLERVLATAGTADVSVAYIELDRDTLAATAATTAATTSATTAATTDSQSTGRYAVNGDKKLVSASMIKLIILETVFQQANAGTIDLNQEVTIRREDVVGGGGVIQNMGGDVTLTVDELCNFMISSSDNDATNALIDMVGMDAVNAEATRLGLTSTTLQRKMMEPVTADQRNQNYTSANDVATLLESIAQGTFVNETYSKKAEQYLLLQQDKTGLRDGIPADVAVASKTGDLDTVYNGGGIVYTEQPYIVVAMVNDLYYTDAQSLVANIATATYEAHESES